MSDTNLLGDYLRARRELVHPESVGLPAGGVRRVPGLRREEVAMLAGISSDYYLRLEQGRDRNPSIQVLEALARVLRLDDAATDYLLGLATPRPRHRRRRPRRETVPASIRQLLDVLDLPAFVEGRYFDVLAANNLARALSPNLQVGQNRLQAVFLDPAERAMYPDWDQASAELVASFRESVGSDTDDPRFVQLVGELSLSSERFRQLWARHDVRSCEGMPTRIQHPQVGELTLSREKLAIGGAKDQLLVIYHGQPGTSSAEKLALLASLASPTATSRPRRDAPANAAPEEPGQV
ncbi:Helix-turn-helix domain-containing protein [Micromonospora rhizosphaerae]|uniref:Helix-turn-helix domain-containing protein n=1 Tax=Micromonospora rhizosphaerae TaxID=568872 RepID=A0A1C6S1F1_9ACTN|nr:helix-turn-helix transcriptional regulator [Micromonospora rhizosphaerae]SCL23278.1 Helix-turn-helix domain-containing protein [Micromonospora rhizosphaerae]